MVGALKVIPAYGGNGWQTVIERGGKTAASEIGLSHTYYAAYHLRKWDGCKPN